MTLCTRRLEFWRSKRDYSLSKEADPKMLQTTVTESSKKKQQQQEMETEEGTSIVDELTTITLNNGLR